MSVHLDPKRRHDFILLFDVQDGNPNGDPDAGNAPRVDAETQKGLVTDACIKRKIRNYITLAGKDLFPESKQSRIKIYVEEGSILNDKIERAYTELKLPTAKAKSKKKDAQDSSEAEENKGRQTDTNVVSKARDWMCDNFFDIRMFGAVLSTGLNAGQVRGPIQFVFGRSIDPIAPMEVAVTRCAATNASEDKENKTMGRKWIVPYGLYRTHGFFNPALAEQTGVDEDDLAIFWKALINMFECDRSSARGLMSVQGLWVFTHECKWGNAAAHKLFNLVEIHSQVEIPRSFDDYEVKVPSTEELPQGITLTRLA